MAGVLLICGGKIHYSFCNTIKGISDSEGKFLGIDHINSDGTVLVSTGEPDKVDAQDVDPVTHIKVIKNKHKKKG